MVKAGRSFLKTGSLLSLVRSTTTSVSIYHVPQSQSETAGSVAEKPDLPRVTIDVHRSSPGDRSVIGQQRDCQT
jgi:hypothetical protein